MECVENNSRSREVARQHEPALYGQIQDEAGSEAGHQRCGRFRWTPILSKRYEEDRQSAQEKKSHLPQEKQIEERPLPEGLMSRTEDQKQIPGGRQGDHAQKERFHIWHGWFPPGIVSDGIRLP